MDAPRGSTRREGKRKQFTPAAHAAQAHSNPPPAPAAARPSKKRLPAEAYDLSSPTRAPAVYGSLAATGTHTPAPAEQLQPAAHRNMIDLACQSSSPTCAPGFYGTLAAASSAAPAAAGPLPLPAANRSLAGHRSHAAAGTHTPAPAQQPQPAAPRNTVDLSSDTDYGVHSSCAASRPRAPRAQAPLPGTSTHAARMQHQPAAQAPFPGASTQAATMQHQSVALRNCRNMPSRARRPVQPSSVVDLSSDAAVPVATSSARAVQQVSPPAAHNSTLMSELTATQARMLFLEGMIGDSSYGTPGNPCTERGRLLIGTTCLSLGTKCPSLDQHCREHSQGGSGKAFLEDRIWAGRGSGRVRICDTSCCG